MKKKLFVISIIFMFVMTGFVSTVSANKEYRGIVCNFDYYPHEDIDVINYCTAFSLVGVIEDSEDGSTKPCILENIVIYSDKTCCYMFILPAFRFYWNALLQFKYDLDIPIILPFFISGEVI